MRDLKTNIYHYLRKNHIGIISILLTVLTMVISFYPKEKIKPNKLIIGSSYSYKLDDFISSDSLKLLSNKKFFNVKDVSSKIIYIRNISALDIAKDDFINSITLYDKDNRIINVEACSDVYFKNKKPDDLTRDNIVWKKKKNWMLEPFYLKAGKDFCTSILYKKLDGKELDISVKGLIKNFDIEYFENIDSCVKSFEEKNTSIWKKFLNIFIVEIHLFGKGVYIFILIFSILLINYVNTFVKRYGSFQIEKGGIYKFLFMLLILLAIAESLTYLLLITEYKKYSKFGITISPLVYLFVILLFIYLFYVLFNKFKGRSK
ncbi:MAG: hypothetical protein N4A44_04530 [Alphaproteobacteria bacterium]|jgi:hypothetical protein|nr:hypothetical protein [Alphaproteobacteria bacterium]